MYGSSTAAHPRGLSFYDSSTTISYGSSWYSRLRFVYDCRHLHAPVYTRLHLFHLFLPSVRQRQSSFKVRPQAAQGGSCSTKPPTTVRLCATAHHCVRLCVTVCDCVRLCRSMADCVGLRTTA